MAHQLPLFTPARPMPLDPEHRLVRLAEDLDWGTLEQIAAKIRRKRCKSNAGRKPHLRALLGAVVLMATRQMTYREAEDQIRHYSPARYLCGLSESDWTPDFTTIQDFVQMLGPEGMRRLNERVIAQATRHKFADPKRLTADTTAQEASIPYPNEVGLMTAFVTAVVATSKRAGRALSQFATSITEQVKAFHRQARRYRLFCRNKADKDAATGKLMRRVRAISARLGKVLKGLRPQGRTKAARDKLQKLQRTMERLLPQIAYWLKTGWVAKGKVISLHCPELYSIVRGKIGKKVEFGLKWGISQIGGGYLCSRGPGRHNFNDKQHVVEAATDHIRQFNDPPRLFVYDRGGYSPSNVEALANLGVKQVGVCPTGNAPWSVGPRIKKHVYKERCRIEGNIGALKRPCYGFNKPGARSAAMMETCGQRALLGFNLNKFARDRVAALAIA